MSLFFNSIAMGGAPNTQLPVLNLEQLITAYEDPNDLEINQKLEELLHSTLVENDLSQEPEAKFHPKLGQYISVVTWNIEYSIKILEVLRALESQEKYLRMLKPELLNASQKRRLANILRQRDRLVNADVILLQEMEIGVPRTHYINAAQEIAHLLKMNYAFAPYQVQIDPTYLMPINLSNEEEFKHQNEFRGLLGSAILSKYKILEASNMPLQTKGYGWYEEELDAATPATIEIIRRKGAKLIFDVDIHRQVKRGTPNFFKVDLEIPEIPEGVLSVVNVHLEIKGPSEMRKQQIEEILSYMKAINTPVIMAGDFNSTNSDIRYYNNQRLVEKLVEPENILSYTLTLTSNSTIGNVRSAYSFIKNYRNPMGLHIPVISPNESRKVLSAVKNFVFDDGTVFDFRGDTLRSQTLRGAASNSNERRMLGYQTTFKLPRTLFGIIGKLKLDWIFVKSKSTPTKWYQKNTNSYRLAPHFGESLYHMNQALKNGPLSDHQPLVVDLPLFEPVQLNKEQIAYEKKQAQKRRRARRR